ncbi:MAG: hypothetical protein JSR77_04335 [Planctomycetes bacterium]|nr:hypothetical protein [Planctomycetota bacterium]
MAGRAFTGLVLTACVFIGACAGPQTTSLRADDLSVTANDMAEKLKESDVMRGRGPTSPPMVIAINKVENLTTDLIPASEQWYMIAKVRDSLPIVAMRGQMQVYFVIPAEHLREGQERGNLPADFAGQRNPTHELTATFRSARRAKGVDQTDAYECEYRLTNIATGELEWADAFGFKRFAAGKSYD